MPKQERFLPRFHRSQLLFLGPVLLAGLIGASIATVPSSVAESTKSTAQPSVTEDDVFISINPNEPSPNNGVVQACSSDGDCRDDGNVCNGVPACVLGQCVAGPPKACWVAGLSCDPTFGCFSANPCSSNSQCPQGQCSSSGTCKPTAPCNNNLDCPSNQFCNGGRGQCEDRPTCSSDAQCGGGLVCDPKTSFCAPACNTNRDCDDHNDCTIDSCDGIRCVHTARSCDDGDPLTGDYCDKTSGCVHDRGGRSQCNSIGVSNTTLTATRATRAIGVTGFTLSGRMNAAFKAKSRIDPSQGRIQITIVDAYGNALVDEAIDPKSEARWKFDSKDVGWTYSSGDPKAGVQKVTISQAKNKFEGFDIKIEGRFNSSLVPDLKALRPVGALIVSWTGDITGPCGPVTVPQCGFRTTPGFGEQLFCRGDEPRGPGR